MTTQAFSSDRQASRNGLLHLVLPGGASAPAPSLERKLQLIIDTIPALAWSARPDGSAEFFNRHFLEFVGYSAALAAGWGWTAAVHPEDRAPLLATWKRILASGQPGEAEARLRRHDGEYRWLLFRAQPLRDATGTITNWYGANTDIEDRKRMEAELRRTHDSFSDAQRLSKTGSFIADVAGDQHQWSEESYRIFGFAPGSRVTLQRIRDAIHADDLPGFEAMIARSIAGTEARFAFRIIVAAGTMKHVRGVAHVSEHVAGRTILVGAMQDVTESVVAEAALGRARSELARVARMTTLSTLTASIAHEVSQPLAGIVTNAGTCLRMLAADVPDMEGAREAARRILRDGDRAANVITRLRAMFSRRELPPEPVDLNEATREVIALSVMDLQRNDVILQEELADNLPCISGDRIQLQQVIINLLRNASEAMSGVHDRPRQLVIRTELENEARVRLLVRDSGVGLEPECAGRLFDAFYTTKAGGMGIGLSVSRSIVERHAGRMWAEANDGAGATVGFSLPVAAVADRA